MQNQEWPANARPRAESGGESSASGAADSSSAPLPPYHPYQQQQQQQLQQEPPFTGGAPSSSAYTQYGASGGPSGGGYEQYPHGMTVPSSEGGGEDVRGVSSSGYYASAPWASGSTGPNPPPQSHYYPQAHQPQGQRQRRISLSGTSREQDGKRYRLVVVQSPSRARMCGFGDKDRRPLSPTLIVKLIIYDVQSGRELAATDVDTSAFFLASDLVHPSELDAAPRNLLVHQHAAAVSAQQAGPSGYGGLAGHEQLRSRSSSDPYVSLDYGVAGGMPGGMAGVGGQWLSGTSSSSSASSPLEGPHAPPTTVMTETYTRNFVGACVASANILKDESEQLGIFFVLQDLSVRTEGVYRIKLTLANLSSSTDGQIRQGVSEALAEAYTESFTVYTPRRFPGVIEPTALSKKFAAQGVKIPVRVDRKKRRRGAAGEEEGEGGSGVGEGPSGMAGAAGPSSMVGGSMRGGGPGGDDYGEDDEGDYE